MKALFFDGDLRATLDDQLAKARRAVDEIPEARFRSTSVAVLAKELYGRFAVQPIVLTEGAISVQAEDADIDRRKLSDIDWGMPGASPTLRGTRVTYIVPFAGDPTLFRLRPSQWSSMLPRADVSESDVRFIYDVRSSEVAGTKARFEQDLTLTKRYVNWSTEQVTSFLEHLVAALEETLARRVARLQQASEGLAALGFPTVGAPREAIDLSRELQATLSPPPPTSTTGHKFDVALSFAGEDRSYVQRVAEHLAQAGASVFYDEFHKVGLWGTDLVEHLQDIYQNQARYCVIFISQHYVSKPWPRHERRSAQARALLANEEYLLPARFDDSPVPGLPPTIGYVDLRDYEPDAFAVLILAKIGLAKPDA